MSFELVDALYRSRRTILDILDECGFEVTKYRNISPKEIEAMSVAQATLNMILPHKEVDGRSAHVIYHLARVSRQKLASMLHDYIKDYKVTGEVDFVIMLNDPIGEMHHKAALEYNMASGADKTIRNVGMFCIYNLVNNPLKHILVPPHKIVPAEAHKQLMESLMISSKGQLPMIKYHQDMIARCIGLVPGDIVKIERPSQSTGVYEIYRVCVP